MDVCIIACYYTDIPWSRLNTIPADEQRKSRIVSAIGDAHFVIIIIIIINIQEWD